MADPAVKTGDPIKDYRLLNEALFNQLMGDPYEKAAAQQDLDNFVRLMARETGVQRRFLPFLPITNDQLTPQVNTDVPAVILFKEPNSPGAINVGYNTNNSAWFVHGDRFLLTFNRVLSPTLWCDKSLLRTYQYDIRQVVTDQLVLDLMAQEDSRFFAAVNSALGTTVNGASPMTGVVQYVGYSGGFSRETFVSSLQILPSTPAHFETQTIVVNNVTAKEIRKWDFMELGGQRSQEVLFGGNAYDQFEDIKWVVTIKRHLVPDQEYYLFADPRGLGKAYSLEDVTMFVDTKAWNILWFCYEEIGTAIVNGYAMARAKFNVT